MHMFAWLRPANGSMNISSIFVGNELFFYVYKNESNTLLIN